MGEVAFEFGEEEEVLDEFAEAIGIGEGGFDHDLLVFGGHVGFFDEAL